MRLVKSYEDSSKAVFCAYNPDRTINKRDFIVVADLDSNNPLHALKRRFVVDHLEFVARTDMDVSWADIDTEVSSIMNAKFHMI